MASEAARATPVCLACGRSDDGVRQVFAFGGGSGICEQCVHFYHAVLLASAVRAAVEGDLRHDPSLPWDVGFAVPGLFWTADEIGQLEEGLGAALAFGGR